MLANRNGTLVGIPFGAFIRTIGAKNARYTCAIASTRNNLFAGSLIRASISNATLQCGSPAAAFAIAHQARLQHAFALLRVVGTPHPAIPATIFTRRKSPAARRAAGEIPKFRKSLVRFIAAQRPKSPLV